jgi:hypothetical protein
MTDREPDMRELHKSEQWLRGVCGDPALSDPKRIKLTARIAVGEAWLADVVEDDVPPGLKERTRQAVRRELQRIRCEPMPGPLTPSRPVSWGGFRRVYRLSAALGLAAVLALAFFATARREAPSTVTQRLSPAEAFEAYAADALGDGLDSLDADLKELELTAALWAERKEIEDVLVDELYEELDGLWGDEAEAVVR